MNNDTLVTAALPYANGPLHLGHLVGYIQSDAWVRALRLEGRTAHFVCADDTHGTPIMLAAEKRGQDPEHFIAQIQANHEQDFQSFGVAFDRYDSTHSPSNHRLTQAIYQKLLEQGHISRRQVEQFYDPIKGIFLPDRYVKGECPRCGQGDQYGDNCETCGASYGPTELKKPYSVLTGATPERRSSEHIFFEVGHFESNLRQWLSEDVAVAPVKAKLKEWLDTPEGLRPWDISRDAPYFGVPIPNEPGKFFYVWLDAPIGYLSTFQALCQEQPETFSKVWKPGSAAQVHHFIGKDIVTFHGLFWPALLAGAGLRAPTRLHVNGYLTVDGKKMSKSRGTFILARTYLEAGLDPEALRYYFAAKNAGQVDDLDLNLKDFAARVNADVVGKFVNLASRCQGFVHARFEGRLAPPSAPEQYHRFVRQLDSIRQAYSRNDTADAIRQAMALADEANRTVAALQPWVLAKQPGQEEAIHAACSQGIHLFRVIACALKPVLPRTAAHAEAFLRAPVQRWEDVQTPLPAGHRLAPYEPLFVRVLPEHIQAMVEASKEPEETPSPARPGRPR